jgi:hypothetical protein
VPYSTNTDNNEFGHAQVLRDIEYLYLYLRGDTTTTVQQSVNDDGFTGDTLDSRIGNIARNFVGNNVAVPPVLRPILVTSSANNKALGYASLRGAVYNATPFSGANPLATAYNPDSEVAITDDGIAYAQDITNGSAPCLIINRGVSGVGGGIITFDMPQTCVFLCYRQVSVPVSGGSSVEAWEAYWA